MSDTAKSILLLNGSPHENGFTMQIANLFLQQLKGFRTEQINAYDYNISPCTGCGYCSWNSGCIYDDFDEIAAKIENADGLIIASPVYFLSFPAPLKAIADRCQRYYAAHFIKHIRPTIRKPKAGVLLMTCGSQDSFGFEVMRRQVRQLYSVMNTQFVGYAGLSGTDKEKEISLPEKEIDALAEKFSEIMRSI